jgi:hypothetical protein
LRFVLIRFLRLHVLGPDIRLRSTESFAVDGEDGPCPSLAPVAPPILRLAQRFDFRVERIEAFGLFVVKLVQLAELVGFVFGFRQRLRLFRRQRQRLASHFPETAQGVEIDIGPDIDPFPALLPHALGLASSFSATSRSSVRQLGRRCHLGFDDPSGCFAPSIESQTQVVESRDGWTMGN